MSELMRRAAKVLRDHATAAEGDLAALFDELAGDQADVDTWDAAMSHVLDHELGNYCALMHPSVALALAAWLERIAAEVDRHIGGLKSPKVRAHGLSVMFPGWTETEAVARAILREDT